MFGGYVWNKANFSSLDSTTLIHRVYISLIQNKKQYKKSQIFIICLLYA